MFPRLLARSTRGIYYSSSAVTPIVTAAHTSLQGFWWLLNPVGSGVKAMLRRMILEYTGGAIAVSNSRLSLERITFTGVSSATVIGAIQRNSIDAAPLCLPVAATTGITPATVSANARLWASLIPQIITAAGVITAGIDVLWPENEDSMAILNAGEGVVIRQPDAGVASDPRNVVISAEWEEFS